MAQWDYRKIDLNNVPRKTEDIDLLNEAGLDGWELMSITPNNFAYLKRRFDGPTAPAREMQPAARATRPKVPTNAK
jgi:hypothetical protein